MEIKEMSTRDLLVDAMNGMVEQARSTLANGGELIPVALVITRTNTGVFLMFEDALFHARPMLVVADRVRAMVAASEAERVVLLYEAWAIERAKDAGRTMERPSQAADRYDVMVAMGVARDGCQIMRSYRIERSDRGRALGDVAESDTFESITGNLFDPSGCAPETIRAAKAAISAVEARGDMHKAIH